MTFWCWLIWEVRAAGVERWAGKSGSHRSRWPKTRQAVNASLNFPSLNEDSTGGTIQRCSPDFSLSPPETKFARAIQPAGAANLACPEMVKVSFFRNKICPPPSTTKNLLVYRRICSVGQFSKLSELTWTSAYYKIGLLGVFTRFFSRFLARVAL